MFAVIFILILFLPGALLPVALKTSFTANELNDMGVYSEEIESLPISHQELVSLLQGRSSCLCTSLCP